ncbi:hypothetical protein E3E14_07210 [Streptomyces sp. ICN441]|uniref:hypothetical protein n=1 Tax=Streptomyces sp. ICN441 TaxID=2558286 RepID=UPI00106C8F1F|nr:hypothetical protein [Streptomyces sp. ICN441]TFE54710.1 hypothetical protein E3E14_07210 [Streptomyces sp. ICN441]
MTTSARVLREQLAAIKHLRDTYAGDDPNHPLLARLDQQIADLESQPGVGKNVAATDEPFRRTLADQERAARREEFSLSRAERAAFRDALRIRYAFGGVRE